MLTGLTLSLEISKVKVLWPAGKELPHTYLSRPNFGKCFYFYPFGGTKLNKPSHQAAEKNTAKNCYETFVLTAHFQNHKHKQSHLFS
jgi:hypothetical protein